MGVISLVNTEVTLNNILFKDFDGEETGIDAPESLVRYMYKPLGDRGGCFIATGDLSGEWTFRFSPTSETYGKLMEVYTEDTQTGTHTLWHGNIKNTDTGQMIHLHNGMNTAVPMWPDMGRDSIGSVAFTFVFVIQRPDFTNFKAVSLRQPLPDVKIGGIGGGNGFPGGSGSGGGA